METLGRHLIVEFHGCNPETLNNLEFLEQSFGRAALETGATIVGKSFRCFSPQGISGVVVIEESHLTVHTWPEKGYAAVDIYTCGDCDPQKAIPVLQKDLEACRVETLTLRRGLEIRWDSDQSISSVEHTINSFVVER